MSKAWNFEGERRLRGGKLVPRSRDGSVETKNALEEWLPGVFEHINLMPDPDKYRLAMKVFGFFMFFLWVVRTLREVRRCHGTVHGCCIPEAWYPCWMSGIIAMVNLLPS